MTCTFLQRRTTGHSGGSLKGRACVGTIGSMCERATPPPRSYRLAAALAGQAQGRSQHSVGRTERRGGPGGLSNELSDGRPRLLGDQGGMEWSSTCWGLKARPLLSFHLGIHPSIHPSVDDTPSVAAVYCWRRLTLSQLPGSRVPWPRPVGCRLLSIESTEVVAVTQASKRANMMITPSAHTSSPAERRRVVAFCLLALLLNNASAEAGYRSGDVSRR